MSKIFWQYVQHPCKQTSQVQQTFDYFVFSSAWHFLSQHLHIDYGRLGSCSSAHAQLHEGSLKLYNHRLSRKWTTSPAATHLSFSAFQWCHWNSRTRKCTTLSSAFVLLGKPSSFNCRQTLSTSWVPFFTQTSSFSLAGNFLMSLMSAWAFDWSFGKIWRHRAV